MSAQFWSTHFGWPSGDVYGNLIASALLGAPVVWRARMHWRRHVARHERTQQLLREVHARLNESTATEDET